eukprot:s278_g53.t1
MSYSDPISASTQISRVYFNASKCSCFAFEKASSLGVFTQRPSVKPVHSWPVDAIVLDSWTVTYSMKPLFGKTDPLFYHRRLRGNSKDFMAALGARRAGRSSLGPARRPLPTLARALDWPLSKEEKKHCLIQVCQREIEESEAQMDEQQEEIEELQHEVKALRRLSTRSTAAETISPRSEEAPAELSEAQEAPVAEPVAPVPREELLQQALVAYFHERSRLSLVTNAKKSPSEIAKYYGNSEEHCSELWNSIREKDHLQNLEAVLWLTKSLPSPMAPASPREDVELSRARLWRRVLMRPNRTRQGSTDLLGLINFRYNELRLRALASPQAQELREELQLELKVAWKGENFMSTENLSDAIASIAQTISAPKGKHLRGAVQVASLLIYGLLPASESLEEAETDAFWCFFQLLTEMKTGDDESTRTFRARRVHDLLKVYDPALVEVLNLGQHRDSQGDGDHQGLMVFVATRLGEAFCTRSGLALEPCAQLWDVVLADPQGFAFCDFVVCALVLLRRQDLLRLKNDAEALAEDCHSPVIEFGDIFLEYLERLAEALLSLPKAVPLERALRLAKALRALEKQKALRAKAREVHASQSQPEDLGVMKALGSLFGRMRERGADALEVGRSVARCAWPRSQVQEEEKVQKPVEEEMKPLRRRLTDEAVTVFGSEGKRAE